MATTWTIAIDWDRNSNFTGEHDDITQYVLHTEWFVGMQRSYQLTGDGTTLVMRLYNEDRQFSPENNSSPLSGKLVPLRPVRIQSNDGVTTRTHWTGWLATIIPRGNPNGDRQVDVIAHGAMQFLKASETKIELQENQRTDQIIDILLKEVIIPPALTEAWVLGDAVRLVGISHIPRCIISSDFPQCPKITCIPNLPLSTTNFSLYL